MRILSLGAGAVGGTVASRLAKAGIDVRVLDANAEHVARLREPGLIVDGIDGGATTALHADTDVPPGPFDLVLLAVRSRATGPALEAAMYALSAHTDVVSLQNGLNEDRIADIVGPQRTIGCVVGFGATWIEPGRIELNTEGELRIGRLDGSSDERLERARDVLSHAFETRTTENIAGALWAKMLVNSMTVLGALGGMLTGDVLSTPERRRLVADVVAEGVRVARAEGVELPKVFGVVDPAEADGDRWHELMEDALVGVREVAGAIKSVTWRDFELGRPTEIDAVTGEIARRGGSLGVPTPLSASVYGMLHEIEAGRAEPAAGNLDALTEVRS